MCLPLMLNLHGETNRRLVILCGVSYIESYVNLSRTYSNIVLGTHIVELGISNHARIELQIGDFDQPKDIHFRFIKVSLSILSLWE